MLGAFAATTAQVVARCARWSVERPYAAALREARDQPAPPAAMAGYSACSRLTTTATGLLYTFLAGDGGGQLPSTLLLTFAFVLLAGAPAEPGRAQLGGRRHPHPGAGRRRRCEGVIRADLRRSPRQEARADATTGCAIGGDRRVVRGTDRAARASLRGEKGFTVTVGHARGSRPGRSRGGGPLGRLGRVPSLSVGRRAGDTARGGARPASTRVMGRHGTTHPAADRLDPGGGSGHGAHLALRAGRGHPGGRPARTRSRSTWRRTRSPPAPRPRRCARSSAPCPNRSPRRWPGETSGPLTNPAQISGLTRRPTSSPACPCSAAQFQNAPVSPAAAGRSSTPRGRDATDAARPATARGPAPAGIADPDLRGQQASNSNSLPRAFSLLNKVRVLASGPVTQPSGGSTTTQTVPQANVTLELSNEADEAARRHTDGELGGQQPVVRPAGCGHAGRPAGLSAIGGMHMTTICDFDRVVANALGSAVGEAVGRHQPRRACARTSRRTRTRTPSSSGRPWTRRRRSGSPRRCGSRVPASGSSSSGSASTAACSPRPCGRACARSSASGTSPSCTTRSGAARTVAAPDARAGRRRCRPRPAPRAGSSPSSPPRAAAARRRSRRTWPPRSPTAAGARSALVDLDLAFGDVAIALQLFPAHTIADAVPLGDNLDFGSLQTLLTPHSPGLTTLVAPVEPGTARGRSRRAWSRGSSRCCATTTTTSSSTRRRRSTTTCCRRSTSRDVVALIATLDIPALKNLKLTLETMDLLNYPRERWRVVLNRADSKVGPGDPRGREEPADADGGADPQLARRARRPSTAASPSCSTTPGTR